jgi:hypothetical protein
MEIAMTMHSSYSLHRKNRPLVGCLTVLIGVPIMCCCLGGLFYGILPMLEQNNSSSLPILILVVGLILTLMMTGLGLALFFFWYRKNNSSKPNS